MTIYIHSYMSIDIANLLFLNSCNNIRLEFQSACMKVNVDISNF